jgi:hypothetical protein
MLKKIQERIFPFLIATSALSVSASAAFYSVSGLSKLFAGATLAVIIMAGSLEVAKLVIASLLYQYRKTLPTLLKVYLTIACAVLILITSMGIYGFLSAAYQETANKAGNIEAQITLVETKRDNIQSQLSVYNTEKSNIDKAVADLRTGLANNVITYTDANGNLVQTTSSSTRRALEKQLDQAIERQSNLNSKVDTLNTQLFNYETEIVEIKTGNDLAGELGPLKYISGLTGIPMDKVINYLLMTIIFVFDPLAISLVIAANFAFEKLKGKTNMYGEEIVEEKTDKKMKWFNWFKKKDDVSYPEPQVESENSDIEYDPMQTIIDNDQEMELWDNTLQDGLEDEGLTWDEYGNPEPIIEDIHEPEPQPEPQVEEMDVNQDGTVDEEDARRIEEILRNPNLPDYKRNYWNAILLQVKKRIRDKGNTITYN